MVWAIKNTHRTFKNNQTGWDRYQDMNPVPISLLVDNVTSAPPLYTYRLEKSMGCFLVGMRFSLNY